jgi:predicted NodU family carbamoyl transferase
MKVVLGLNYGHDGAAAVVREGRLVAAVSLERLSRHKKESGVTRELVAYVLELAGVTFSEIGAVALAAFIPSPRNPIPIFKKGGEEITSPVFDLFGGETSFALEAEVEGRRVPAFFIKHHIAHYAAAFFTSPFERAACLSVDASMVRPEACSVMAYGEGEDLRYLRCPGIMIGNAYSVITEKLGLGPGLTKAGTLMGLAPYGKPNAAALTRWRELGASFYERTVQQSDPIFIEYISKYAYQTGVRVLCAAPLSWVWRRWNRGRFRALRGAYPWALPPPTVYLGGAHVPREIVCHPARACERP